MGKNNKLYVIIVILIAIICLLVGFIIGGNVLRGDTNNDNGISENEKTVTLTESEGKELFEKVSVYNDYFLQDYSVNGIKSAINNNILYFLTEQLDGFGADGRKTGFTPNDLKKVADEYLADDINVLYTDIFFPSADRSMTGEYMMYKLGSDSKYTDIPLQMGGPGSFLMKEYYIDGYYNETKDEYIVNTKLLFNQWCPDICGPHDKYYSDVELKNFVYNVKSEDILDVDFDDVYNQVKDVLPITSYKFTKNNSGNYVLSSVTVK